MGPQFLHHVRKRPQFPITSFIILIFLIASSKSPEFSIALSRAGPPIHHHIKKGPQIFHQKAQFLTHYQMAQFLHHVIKGLWGMSMRGTLESDVHKPRTPSLRHYLHSKTPIPISYQLIHNPDFPYCIIKEFQILNCTVKGPNSSSRHQRTSNFPSKGTIPFALSNGPDFFIMSLRGCEVWVWEGPWRDWCPQAPNSLTTPLLTCYLMVIILNTPLGSQLLVCLHVFGSICCLCCA